jgi:hypothetical protein
LRVGNSSRRDEMPLKPQVTLQVFEKWAIYFVGPINPPTRILGESYIITGTQYRTIWAESTTIKYCNA